MAKFDSLGLIIMEQCEAPGSLGDSCAETFRYFLLDLYIRDSKSGLSAEEWHTRAQGIQAALRLTQTVRGYLRHPDVPIDWREGDFTSDQFLPRQVVEQFLNVNFDMYRFLESNSYCTNFPPTKLAQPGLFCAYNRGKGQPSLFWDAVAILGQALLFKFPYRWDDGRSAFESVEESSCDYLNWFMLLVQCEIYGCTVFSRLAKRLVSSTTLKMKVASYYAKEPNSLWILQLYEQAIDKAYTKT
jgi:hypothetical protein